MAFRISDRTGPLGGDRGREVAHLLVGKLGGRSRLFGDQAVDPGVLLLGEHSRGHEPVQIGFRHRDRGRGGVSLRLGHLDLRLGLDDLRLRLRDQRGRLLDVPSRPAAR